MPTARTTQAPAFVCVLAALCPCAFGLNPSQEISQYAHTAWTVRDGFFKGTISSITQTADGYLWLGTEFGLVRFDGVRTVEWKPPGGERLPSSDIRCLFGARDGTLWIGTSSGLASWNGVRLVRHAELDGRTVWSILEDREGTIWAGGSQGGANGWLCAIRNGKTECHGQDGSLGTNVSSLYEDVAGNLWAGAQSGLWRWKPGAPARYPMQDAVVFGLVQDGDGKLLVGALGGMFQLLAGKVVPYRIPGIAGTHNPHLLRDRDGGLWIGSYSRELIHLYHGRTDVFSRLDGLSANEVNSLYEDREGNVWVATRQGLDRFRELPVVSVSVKQGLATDAVYAVLAAKDGSLWLTGANGLDRWKDGKVTNFRSSDGLPGDRSQSLYQDEAGRIWVYSSNGLAWFDGRKFVPVPGVADGDVVIAGNAGHLWLAHNRGLLHFREGRLDEEFPWSRLGYNQRTYAMAADPKGGGVWLGFHMGAGVAYFKDGQVAKLYTHADGLGGGRISNLQLDPDGTLWAATEGGSASFNRGVLPL